VSKPIIIIGAGIGGLSAGIRLAQQGHKVTILEARSDSGGLASGFTAGGFLFDAGPYILLDKPGLSWAMQQLNIDVNKQLALIPIENIYHVLQEDGSEINFDNSIENTAQKFETRFPNSGQLYKNFVEQTFKIYLNLQPLTFTSHPSPFDVLRNGSAKNIPFMLRSLGAVLKRTGLPPAIQKGISIWTNISGQPVDKSPSPMAFVPALFHNIGCYYPKGGMQSIATLLNEKALQTGVEIEYNTKVAAIQSANKKIVSVTTIDGDVIDADIVISNAAGVGTYTELLNEINVHQKAKLEKLPLQSPGVCVYLSVKGKNLPYYIRFKQQGLGCTAFVQPGLMDPSLENNGWYPARLIAPLDHEAAAKLGTEGQYSLMNKLVQDKWWQQGISEYKVLHQQTTFEWGNEYNLYRNSMNPVMTAAFMRKGRLAHKSPYTKGLYLAGSATHPGQWVSFCAISGILAANCVIKDL
jgi:phytoene dehydrogenase-like protein